MMNSKQSYHNEKAERGRLAGRLYPSDKRFRIILIAMGVIAIAFLVMMIVLNVMPPDLTVVILLVMFLLMGAASILFAGPGRGRHIAGIAVAVIFAVIFIYGTSFMVSTFEMLSKISATGTKASGPKPLKVNVAEEPFNLYVTGIDQWACEKGEDLERSDVNMIITVNPKTKKILLTSIPRDTYVKLHTSKQMDKLTHSGIYGVDETLNTVHDWLGIDLNYYVKMNFTGARDIINAMGGIEVYSPVAFTSDLKGYEYKKGWNFLGGKEALYFARERHAFEGKDYIRVRNQQSVVKAMIKKMTSSRVMLTKYGDIMDAAGEEMSTNLSADEMTALARLQITDLADWDIETQRIEGREDMDIVASMAPSQQYLVYRPYESSVESCKANIEEVLNPTAKEIRAAKAGKSKSFIVNVLKKSFSRKPEDQGNV